MILHYSLYLCMLVVVFIYLLCLKNVLVSPDICLCVLCCSCPPISLGQLKLVFISRGLSLLACIYSLSVFWYRSEFIIRLLFSILDVTNSPNQLCTFQIKTYSYYSMVTSCSIFIKVIITTLYLLLIYSVQSIFCELELNTDLLSAFLIHFR